MDRRKFIALSGAGVIGLSMTDKLSLAQAVTKKRNQNYNIVIVGDTHYDVEPSSVYHANHVDVSEKALKLHTSEWKRNGEMWRDRCPRLLKRAQKLINKDTKMIFQMGDLIQGDCGGKEIHKKMLADGIARIKQDLGDTLPFVTVVGNHDIRGLDAQEAYAEYMPKIMSAELGQEITQTTFSFTIVNDAYIVVDFNKPDVKLLDKLLKQADGARHIFILSHGTLFPADNKYDKWFLFGARGSVTMEDNKEHRLYFRHEFAKRNVIALCGHTHFTELEDWYGDGGRITQMVMSSVFSKDSYGKYEELTKGAEQYGSFRARIHPDLPADTEMFDEYRSGMKRYSTALSAGSYQLNVSDKLVSVDFYAGDSAEMSHQFILRQY